MSSLEMLLEVPIPKVNGGGCVVLKEGTKIMESNFCAIMAKIQLESLLQNRNNTKKFIYYELDRGKKEIFRVPERVHSSIKVRLNMGAELKIQSEKEISILVSNFIGATLICDKNVKEIYVIKDYFKKFPNGIIKCSQDCKVFVDEIYKDLKIQRGDWGGKKILEKMN